MLLQKCEKCNETVYPPENICATCDTLSEIVSKVTEASLKELAPRYFEPEHLCCPNCEAGAKRCTC